MNYPLAVAKITQDSIKYSIFQNPIEMLPSICKFENEIVRPSQEEWDNSWYIQSGLGKTLDTLREQLKLGQISQDEYSKQDKEAWDKALAPLEKYGGDELDIDIIQDSYFGDIDIFNDGNNVGMMCVSHFRQARIGDCHFLEVAKEGEQVGEIVFSVWIEDFVIGKDSNKIRLCYDDGDM